MKALSIKQPWAHLIATGIKDIENRTWRTNFRGRIYIHASSKIVYYKDLSLVQLTNVHTQDVGLLEKIVKKDITTSAIIGEVDIVDCVQDHPSMWAEKHSDNILGEFINKPIWNWVLANPVLYDKPILNVKGKLSFWEPDICLQTCESCQEPTVIETMSLDDGDNWFCPECWKELAPVMAQDMKELKDKGEI